MTVWSMDEPSWDLDIFLYDLAMSSSVVCPLVLLILGTGSGLVGLVRSGEGVEGVMIGAPGTARGVDLETDREGDSGS